MSISNEQKIANYEELSTMPFYSQMIKVKSWSTLGDVSKSFLETYYVEKDSFSWWKELVEKNTIQPIVSNHNDTINIDVSNVYSQVMDLSKNKEILEKKAYFDYGLLHLTDRDFDKLEDFRQLAKKVNKRTWLFEYPRIKNLKYNTDNPCPTHETKCSCYRYEDIRLFFVDCIEKFKDKLFTCGWYWRKDLYFFIKEQLFNQLKKNKQQNIKNTFWWSDFLQQLLSWLLFGNKQRKKVIISENKLTNS